MITSLLEAQSALLAESNVSYLELYKNHGGRVALCEKLIEEVVGIWALDQLAYT